MSSPGGALDVRVPAKFQSIQLVIPTAVMSDAAFALDGRERHAPLEFAPHVVLDSGPGAGFVRLVRYLLNELDSDDSLIASPLVTARMVDALLYYLLLRQPNNLSASASRAPDPVAVRRAAEYLEAHAADPIRLAEVAAVAGLGVRALQTGFRRYRGCSPMEFLRERRLLLARAQLLHAPEVAVARAAHDCGFEHLGRFSAYYRARFAESPQETLRRRRG